MDKLPPLVAPAACRQMPLGRLCASPAERATVNSRRRSLRIGGSRRIDQPRQGLTATRRPTPPGSISVWASAIRRFDLRLVTVLPCGQLGCDRMARLVLMIRRSGRKRATGSPQASSICMGCNSRVSGLRINPSISNVTTPRRAWSVCSPRITGV
jgi:hypothetical protein